MTMTPTQPKPWEVDGDRVDQLVRDVRETFLDQRPDHPLPGSPRPA